MYNPTTKMLIKSKDCYQYDSDGKEYIDFESGVWCANIGHSNDRLIELIGEQIKKSIHHGYKFRNQFSEDLSERLNTLTGITNGASVFISSGSEAVNLSVSLSFHYTGRKKILKINNSYLSAFGFGQNSPNNDSIVNVQFNDIDSINTIDFKEISAFVLETGGASIDMVQFPEKNFISKIVDMATKNDCLIIADEVTTGIGRTGKWFGFQHYDIKPDIVVTGKGLGNGYPVSAVTANSKVTDYFNKNPFRYAQSHQNDPLGCAIGLEVLNIIEEEKLIDKCIETGEYFNLKLIQLAEKYPEKIKEIRARGLILALELKKDIDGDFIHTHLFGHGFVTGFKSNTFRFLPPFTIKQSDIDKLVTKLDDLLISSKSKKIF